MLSEPSWSVPHPAAKDPAGEPRGSSPFPKGLQVRNLWNMNTYDIPQPWHRWLIGPRAIIWKIIVIVTLTALSFWYPWAGWALWIFAAISVSFDMSIAIASSLSIRRQNKELLADIARQIESTMGNQAARVGRTTGQLLDIAERMERTMLNQGDPRKTAEWAEIRAVLVDLRMRGRLDITIDATK